MSKLFDKAMKKVPDYIKKDVERAMKATEIVGRGKKVKLKDKIVKVESIGDWFSGMMNERNDD